MLYLPWEHGEWVTRDLTMEADNKPGTRGVLRLWSRT